MTITYRVSAAVLMLVAGACGRTASPPPGAAPMPPSRADTTHAAHGAGAVDSTAVPTPVRVMTDTKGRRFTSADVEFMQHMIWHHSQALAMTALLPSRTVRPDMRALAERIAVSQQDEIASMRDWLLDRGQEAPNPDPAHAHHDAVAHSGMPGMLTPAQLAALAAARGTEFERSFLELMIRHHEGAITMVRRLFSSPASGQDSQLYSFASDVEADQDAEISRMRRLLAGLPTGTPRP